MAKIKITKRTVEALKVMSKDYIAFDTDLPGFGVRIMPSGKRFFLVQYRRHGRTRRVMIGQFGIVTAELARREATIKLGNVRGADGDPAALRDADRQSTTMKELGERFLTRYVPVRCKPSTQAEYRRSVELFLDPLFAKQRVRSKRRLSDVRIHDLRHTFASGGLLVGEGLAMIGKLLGHTQVQTTAKYAHLASDPVKQAATKISDRLALDLLRRADEPSARKAKQSNISIDNEANDPVAA